MKHILRFGFTAAAVLVFASAGYAQPNYALTIDGESSFRGDSGASVDLGGSYDLNLTEADNDGADGAQGWSISVTSDGVAITGITTEGTVAADVSMGGLRNTGFEVSETTTAFRDGDECAGDGAVSAVVLSFVMNITLPTNETSTIGKIETAGSADAPAVELDGSGDCVSDTADAGSISFAQGCQGSGQPVDNNVTWMGQTISPTRGSLALSVSAEICPITNCNESTPGGLKIYIEDAVLSGDEVTSGGPDNPGKINVDGLADGEIGSTTIYADIVSDLSDTGVQGWSLSAAVCAGDIAIVNATTDDTDAADHTMGGLRNTGFEVSELTTLSEGGSSCDGLNGAVSAVVLSFVMNITLPSSGSNRVLCLDVEATAEMPACDLSDEENPVAGSVSGTIAWKDGCQGAGQPVNNVATVAGNTVAFACCQTVSVCFNGTCITSANAVPCDANRDGKVDLADAVTIVNDLFRDGDSDLSYDCVAAYDCDEDGLATIGDALAAAVGLFAGGPLPAAGLAGECVEYSSDSGLCDESSCEL